MNGIPTGIHNVLYSWPIWDGALVCKKFVNIDTVLRINDHFATQPQFYEITTLGMVKFQFKMPHHNMAGRGLSSVLSFKQIWKKVALRSFVYG